MASEALGKIETSRGDAAELYGLLYIDAIHGRHANLSREHDPIDIYIGCASLTAQSAERTGESFSLVTNSPSDVSARLERLGLPPFRTVEIDFSLDVPTGIPFYQAHYKLAVLRAFATGELGNFVCLIDIDTFIQRKFSSSLSRTGLTAYDITDVVPPSYRESLAALTGAGTPCRWYGGEFIAGPAHAFGRLQCGIETMSDAYFSRVYSLPHIGDETLVSAALNVISSKGETVEDASTTKAIARWWSSRTTIRQPSFRNVEDASILHLPADKPFLFQMAGEIDALPSLRARYKSHMRSKVLHRCIANPILNFLSKERKYAPEL